MNNNMQSQPRDPWLRRQWNNAHGAGKGDTRRPEDKEKFDEGYERVFGHCSTHPDYQALRKPTADCIVCRRLWREAELRRASLPEGGGPATDGRGEDEQAPPSSGGRVAGQGGVSGDEQQRA